MKPNKLFLSTALLLAVALSSCSKNADKAMENLKTFGLFRVAPNEAYLQQAVDDLNLHYNLFKEGKEELSAYPYLPTILALGKAKQKDIPVTILQEFLDAGADINAVDSNHNSALILALMHANPNVEVVDFLLKNGAKPDADGKAAQTCLYVQDEEKKLKLLNMVLGAGFPVNKTLKVGGCTLLTFAIQREDSEKVIAFLLSKGADVNAVSTAGMTPLMAAEDFGRGEAIRRCLMEKKADIHYVNEEGMSALAILCRHGGSIEEMQTYLDAGADATLVNAAGESLVDIALNGESDEEAEEPATLLHSPRAAFIRNARFEQLIQKAGKSEPSAADTVIATYLKDGFFTPVSELSATAGDDLMEHYIECLNGEESADSYPYLACMLCIAKEKKVTVSPQDAESLLALGGQEKAAYNKHSALCYALEAGNDDVAKLLVEKGAEVQGCKEDESVQHPLWLAAWRGNAEMAKYLVEHGADINAKVGDIPLVLKAYDMNATTIADTLWQAGANPNVLITPQEGLTMDSAIYCLRNEKLAPYAEQFILHGSRVDATLNNKMAKDITTPVLMVAVAMKQLGAAKALLERGAKVNEQMPTSKVTPLMIAAMQGNTKMVELLLHYGADSSLKDENRKTVQDYILTNPNMEIVMDIALHDAIIKAAINGDLQALRENIKTVDDIYTLGLSGSNLLGIVSQGSHEDCVKFFLNLGADVNHPTPDGETPLFDACRFGNAAAVKLLIAAGADVNHVSRNGDTPLESACRKGRTDIIGLLLESGADINKAPTNGNNALSAACIYAHADAVKLLLESGATVSKSKKGGYVELNIVLDYIENKEWEKRVEKMSFKSEQEKTAEAMRLKKGFEECAELLKQATAQ